MAASPCLDGDRLADFVAGTLQSADVARVEAHVAECSRCATIIADAAAAMDADCDAPGELPFDMPPSSSAPLPAFGDLLARKYRVTGRLGQGGMGEVFAAQHVELGLRVAIKVLHSGNPEADARFLREAQTCARLQNAHIPRVFDIGRLPSGVPYMVMECLVGEDLAEQVARGPLDPSEAVGYIVQACVALSEAHAAGIVHRDIKPANLFLQWQQDGPPLLKVLDFGISKLEQEALSERCGSSSSAHNLTSASTILGSPEYMSPEQIRESREVDARADIWSLGVVLYHLLSGRPPFRAPTFPELARSIALDRATSLRELCPDVPEGLEQTVSRCLEKSPERRFGSVEDLARALVPFIKPEYAILVPPALLGGGVTVGKGNATSRHDRLITEHAVVEPNSAGVSARFSRPQVLAAGSLGVAFAGFLVISTGGFLQKSSALVRSSGPSAQGPSAGGDGPKIDVCAGRGVVAEGTDPLIDDIEDGDSWLRPLDHRKGRWFVFADPGCIVEPKLAEAAAPGGHNPSRFAMHVGAERCTNYGYGFSVALNSNPRECAYDASVYDGVYFWARSGPEPVTAAFEVATRPVEPLSQGGDGTCEPHCWDSHFTLIALAPDWQQYSVRWTDLAQHGWGTPARFDVKQIASLNLRVKGESKYRELWVDQLGFFKGAPPMSPFRGEP